MATSYILDAAIFLDYEHTQAWRQWVSPEGVIFSLPAGLLRFLMLVLSQNRDPRSYPERLVVLRFSSVQRPISIR